jgi:glutamine synthetase
LATLLLEYKNDEWARFNSAVTDWERTMYWDDTP